MYRDSIYGHICDIHFDIGSHNIMVKIGAYKDNDDDVVDVIVGVV